jgi:hypothetical protein
MSSKGKARPPAVAATKTERAKSSQSGETESKAKRMKPMENKPRPQKDDNDDERFAAVRKDPRFRAPKFNDDNGGGRRVVVDERFSAMFTDDEFKSSRAKVDKYGRKNTNKDQGLGDLSRHYVLSEAEQERLDKLNRIARGEADDEDLPSSSSEESESDEEAEAEEEEAQDGPLLPAEVGGDSSRRLAVVSCDWDHIRAVDILAMLKSFTPSTGTVLDVAVYSSEFGRQRMQSEEVNGPFHNPKETKAEPAEDEDDEEDMGHEAGSGYNPEALRKYGKERLLYYFAVVTCDSVATAETLYRECDGVEFEHSSVTLDLRFIPDNIKFDISTLRDRTSEIPEGYAPADFVSKPLQSTEVDLAWDEPAFDRKKLMRWGAMGGGKKKAEEAIPMEELEAFIASEDDDADDSDEEREKRQQDVDRYRALLGKSAKPGSKDTAEHPEPEEEDEFFVEQEGNDDASSEEDETPAEGANPKQQQHSGNPKRNPKFFVEESQLDEDDDETSKRKGTNKKEKRKLKKEAKKRIEEGDASINVADERFASLFTEPEYALDRTDPRFKLTGTAKKIEEEKRRRSREKKGSEQ